MFAFLASSHRVAPQLEESAEEQESAEQARDGPLSVKYVRALRTLKMPLSWGFKLNHLTLGFVTKIRRTEFGLLYIPAQTDESIARQFPLRWSLTRLSYAKGKERATSHSVMILAMGPNP